MQCTQSCESAAPSTLPTTYRFLCRSRRRPAFDGVAALASRAVATVVVAIGATPIGDRPSTSRTASRYSISGSNSASHSSFRSFSRRISLLRHGGTHRYARSQAPGPTGMPGRRSVTQGIRPWALCPVSESASGTEERTRRDGDSGAAKIRSLCWLSLAAVQVHHLR